MREKIDRSKHCIEPVWSIFGCYIFRFIIYAKTFTQYRQVICLFSVVNNTNNAMLQESSDARARVPGGVRGGGGGRGRGGGGDRQQPRAGRLGQDQRAAHAQAGGHRG